MATWREDSFHHDKGLLLLGPDNGNGYPASIEIYYDDVDHNVIDQYLPLILQALNAIPDKEWKDALDFGHIISQEQEEADLNGYFEE